MNIASKTLVLISQNFSIPALSHHTSYSHGGLNLLVVWPKHPQSTHAYDLEYTKIKDFANNYMRHNDEPCEPVYFLWNYTAPLYLSHSKAWRNTMTQ